MLFCSTILGVIAVLGAAGCTGGQATRITNTVTVPPPVTVTVTKDAALTVTTTEATSVDPAPVSLRHEVLYEIFGSSAGQVSWSTAGFGIAQSTSVSLPWARTVSFPRGTMFVAVVNAQDGGTGGSIGCQISVDGVVVTSNSSGGQFAVVQCTTSQST